MTAAAADPVASRAARRRVEVLGTTAGRGRTDELINLAARMFHENGYDSTSLQDVADELGILKGSLYYYMKSKDDLLYAVILRQHEAAMALVALYQAMDAPPEEKLAALVRGYAHSLAEERAFVAVYLREVDRLRPDRREQILAGRETYVDFVVDLVRGGQRSGSFRRDLDPSLSAQAILGTLNATYRWYRPNGPFTPDQIVAELLKLVMGGVLAEPGRRLRRA